MLLCCLYVVWGVEDNIFTEVKGYILKKEKKERDAPKIPTNTIALLKKINSCSSSRNRSRKWFDLMQLSVLTTPKLYTFLMLYF